MDATRSGYRTQTFLQMAPPLDYSYQDIHTMSELPEHETNDAVNPMLTKTYAPVEHVSSNEPTNTGDDTLEPTFVASINNKNTTRQKTGIMTPLELAMTMLGGDNNPNNPNNRETKGKRSGASDTQAHHKHKKNTKLSKTTGLRLSYNELTDLNGFAEAVESVMDNPIENLRWLDLSHNKLNKVDSVLLQYPNLSVIYLHGNNITNLKTVYQLNKLTKLRKITLHGNPSYFPSFSSTPEPSATEKKKIITLEDKPHYRAKLIYHLRDTSLIAIDFVPITNKDREKSVAWEHNNKKRINKRST